MKITKTQLKQIIKEELETVLSDDEDVRGMAAFYMNTVKPKGKDLSDVAE